MSPSVRFAPSPTGLLHAIERDLGWLGLGWDCRERQSDRLARFRLEPSEARLDDLVRGPQHVDEASQSDMRCRAADRLSPEPWDETTWKRWTGELGRKGRALFHPLRLALTAHETGPEMAKLLPLIGRARAEERLRGQPA